MIPSLYNCTVLYNFKVLFTFLSYESQFFRGRVHKKKINLAQRACYMLTLNKYPFPFAHLNLV